MKLFGEILRVALTSIKANKLKSALTILGIVVGIFSIITISTIISMLQTSIEDGISGGLGQNTFQIQKTPQNMGGDHQARREARKRPNITMDEYYELRDKFDEAESVGAEQWQHGNVAQFEANKTNPTTSIAGVNQESIINNQWFVERGRSINRNDVDRLEKVCLIGQDLVKDLFANIDPLGREIKLDGYRYKIIGILETQGSSFGSNQDRYALIPITTFQTKYGKRSNSFHITVKVKDTEFYTDMIEKARSIFRIVRRLEPTEKDDFSIWSNESMIESFNDTTAGVKIGVLVVAGIALLAAGIGIMNIMLVSVTERTREIGIRKSLGAKKNAILLQFMIEAIILCQIGGAIGIIGGVIVGNLVGSMMDATAVVPLDWVISGVLICVFIGIGFGTYPAYKAANLDPIEALRYE